MHPIDVLMLVKRNADGPVSPQARPLWPSALRFSPPQTPPTVDKPSAWPQNSP